MKISLHNNAYFKALLWQISRHYRGIFQGTTMADFKALPWQISRHYHGIFQNTTMAYLFSTIIPTSAGCLLSSLQVEFRSGYVMYVERRRERSKRKKKEKREELSSQNADVALKYCTAGLITVSSGVRNFPSPVHAVKNLPIPSLKSWTEERRLRGVSKMILADNREGTEKEWSVLVLCSV